MKLLDDILEYNIFELYFRWYGKILIKTLSLK